MIKRFFSWIRSFFAKRESAISIPARLVKPKVREGFMQRMAREKLERREARRKAVAKRREKKQVTTYTATCLYKYCGEKMEVPQGTIQKYCKRAHRSLSRSHSYGTA